MFSAKVMCDDVTRALDPSFNGRTTRGAVLNEATLATLLQALPKGILLVVGAIGSGKTKSLQQLRDLWPALAAPAPLQWDANKAVISHFSTPEGVEILSNMGASRLLRCARCERERARCTSARAAKRRQRGLHARRARGRRLRLACTRRGAQRSTHIASRTSRARRRTRARARHNHAR